MKNSNLSERHTHTLVGLLGIGALSVWVWTAEAQTAPAGPQALSTTADAPPVEEKPNLSEISAKNPFDPKRQQWVEKPPPPPPPPPPPTLTPTDVVLYGVLQVGNMKKAYAKLSPILAGSLPQPKEGRPYELTVGQQLGPFYSVREITADQLVLVAPGVTYTAVFGKKTDRPAPLPMTPLAQAPVEHARPMPTLVPDITTPPPPPPPVATAAAPVNPNQAGTTATGLATAPAAAPANTPPGGRTLLEAIEAARAAQQSGTMPAVPPTNPFTTAR